MLSFEKVSIVNPGAVCTDGAHQGEVGGAVGNRLTPWGLALEHVAVEEDAINSAGLLCIVDGGALVEAADPTWLLLEDGVAGEGCPHLVKVGAVVVHRVGVDAGRLGRHAVAEVDAAPLDLLENTLLRGLAELHRLVVHLGRDERCTLQRLLHEHTAVADGSLLDPDDDGLHGVLVDEWWSPQLHVRCSLVEPEVDGVPGDTVLVGGGCNGETVLQVGTGGECPSVLGGRRTLGGRSWTLLLPTLGGHGRDV